GFHVTGVQTCALPISARDRLQPDAELGPDALVAPGVRVFVDGHLEVEARQLGRAQAVQGEAALVRGVDQLRAGGRHPRQDAEPGERIRALEDALGRRGHAAPGDAVKAVAAHHPVRLEPARLALEREQDSGARAVDVLDREGGRLERELAPLDRAGGLARGDQVLYHLALAVHADAAPR